MTQVTVYRTDELAEQYGERALNMGFRNSSEAEIRSYISELVKNCCTVENYRIEFS